MKYGFLGFGLMMFGMIGLVVIVMFQSITLDNDTEYYTLKEAMKASMYESIDWKYYSNYFTIKKPEKEGYILMAKDDGSDYQRYMGQVKIIEQKFVENFSKRFANNVGGDADEYEIEFYDIIEKPPKVSVKITGNNRSYSYVMGSEEDDKLSIVNNLSGILEVVPAE
ncbi:MAG: DUF5411 family protein [Bacilli bacterium]|nr:DUF5411 family protein [Bacilli bacterium]